MAMLALSAPDGLFYQYEPPTTRSRTFVFVNALTGSAEMWQAEIGPALRDQGYGTLAYNLRGQADSPFAPGTVLDEALIVRDLERLMAEVAPPDPILVGLSIGGLYAARAHLAGASAVAMVLINTLRRPGPRLAWINDAMLRAAATGGTRLLLDMYMPLLVNEDRQREIRASFLVEDPYEPLPPEHGHYGLMQHARNADWDLPYEEIAIPVLILTGLCDRVFYDPDDVAELAARLPNSRRIDLADAGHLIPAERPKETAAALLDFADGL